MGYSFCTLVEALSRLLAKMSDLSLVLSTATVYIAGKALLRRAVGHAPDARGWGLETYLSAAIHQLATTLCGLSIIAMHRSELDDWLTASWTGEDQRAERLLLIMQAVEMATDCVRDHTYAGFGRSYLQHHLSTLAASLAALWLSVPVGCVVAFTTCMEAGGLALNAVSLYRPAMNARSHGARLGCQPVMEKNTLRAPQWLMDLRAFAFSGSRLLAALILAKTTAVSYVLERPCWIALMSAWCIIAVNAPWVVTMLRSAFAAERGSPRGTQDMDTFSK